MGQRIPKLQSLSDKRPIGKVVRAERVKRNGENILEIDIDLNPHEQKRVMKRIWKFFFSEPQKRIPPFKSLTERYKNKS